MDVKFHNLTKLAVAAAIIVAPTAAAAQSALPARASAEMQSPNALDGDSTPVILGLILVVLLGMIVVSDDDEPNNPQPPVSP